MRADVCEADRAADGGQPEGLAVQREPLHRRRVAGRVVLGYRALVSRPAAHRRLAVAAHHVLGVPSQRVVVAAAHAKQSGSLNLSLPPTLTIRCEPVPSAATPASFAAALRLYRASFTGESAPWNSTYLLPRLLPTERPCST